MRRRSIVLFVIVMSVLVISAVACGSSGSAASPGPEQRSPEEVLSAAYEAAYDLTSAAGSFDLGITVQMDPDQVPADSLELAQALSDDGIRVMGTFAYANEPLLADCSFTLTMMGQPLDVGFKMVDDALWLALGGQWYETPAEMTAMVGTQTPQVDVEELRRLLNDLGLDPVTWLQGLESVGEETMDGVTVVHLSGSPDVMKMVNDSFELLQSEEFLKLIDPTGSMSAMLTEGALPGAGDIEEMRSTVEKMFDTMLVDLWVGANDAMIRQMAVSGHIQPPDDMDSEGFLGMDLSVTMSLGNINQVPAVEPPVAPLPFTALEKAIQEDPGLLGPFGDLLGGGYGTAGLAY